MRSCETARGYFRGRGSRQVVRDDTSPTVRVEVLGFGGWVLGFRDLGLRVWG